MNGSRALLLPVILALGGAALTGVPAVAQVAAPATPRITGQGNAAVIIGANAAQLYYYDRDTRGKSNCYSVCAVDWPPVTAKPGTHAHGRFSLVTRHDGKKQWAYDGHPLYYWKNDVNGGSRAPYPISPHWHVAHPAHM